MNWQTLGIVMYFLPFAALFIFALAVIAKECFGLVILKIAAAILVGAGWFGVAIYLMARGR